MRQLSLAIESTLPKLESNEDGGMAFLLHPSVQRPAASPCLWPYAKLSVRIGSRWRQWKSVLWSNYACHSSNFGVCCILDNIVFSSSRGHLPGSSLPRLPTQGTISILSMWLQSISFHNRFLLLFPQACKSNFTQYQNLCSTKNAGIEYSEKIALLLNTACVNRTPLSFLLWK